MSSVGREAPVELDDALSTVGDAARLVYEQLEHLAPTRASVEFGVSFTAQGGKLVALLFDAKAHASLTIRLEWERAPVPAGPSGPAAG